MHLLPSRGLVRELQLEVGTYSGRFTSFPGNLPGEMIGEVAATVTLLDGSQTSGTLGWNATLDPVTGVVTGSVSLPDGDGVIPFTAART